MEQAGVTIVTIKVISSLDLQTIEKYIKNANHINLDEVNTSCLLQSKLYLKIIDISTFSLSSLNNGYTFPFQLHLTLLRNPHQILDNKV